jgi:hypothetical protein
LAGTFKGFVDLEFYPLTIGTGPIRYKASPSWLEVHQRAGKNECRRLVPLARVFDRAAAAGEAGRAKQKDCYNGVKTVHLLI